jgi:voltage-gated potassium channel
MSKNPDFAISHLALFTSILVFICFTTLAGNSLPARILTGSFFGIMLLAASYSIRRMRRILLYIAVGITVIREFSHFLVPDDLLYAFSTVLGVLFFLFIVYQLIRQVAQSREVDRRVILESINAYLLMGISGSVLFMLVHRLQPAAFSVPGSQAPALSDFIYYGFVTQTTIGYGDIIPVSDLARLLSLALGISGQLYIAIIISMLVGKFLSARVERIA